MQRDTLLTQDELDFIQTMQHNPQLNVRDATSSLLVNGGSQIRENDKLGMGIAWAKDVRKELESIYKAGHEMGFLPAIPGPETIWSGSK